MSSCMRAHLQIGCEHGEGCERSCRRRLDCPDAGAAKDTLDDRAGLACGAAAVACLLRCPVGVGSRRCGRTTSFRDRTANADRAIEYLAPNRSAGGTRLCRAPGMRGRRPRSACYNLRLGPGHAAAHVAGLCEGHPGEHRPAAVATRSGKLGGTAQKACRCTNVTLPILAAEPLRN